MAIDGSITIVVRDLDLNPGAGARSATQWIDVGRLDAQCMSVSIEGSGGEPGTAVVTIEVSIDGGKAHTIDSTLCTAQTLTAANGYGVQRVDVSNAGKVRLRVTTAEGSAKNGTAKILLRREGGFDRDLVVATVGGDGSFVESASEGAVGSGGGIGGAEGAGGGSDL